MPFRDKSLFADVSLDRVAGELSTIWKTIGAGALRSFLTCAGSTPTFRKYSCVEGANGTDALQLARSYLAVPKL